MDEAGDAGTTHGRQHKEAQGYGGNRHGPARGGLGGVLVEGEKDAGPGLWKRPGRERGEPARSHDNPPTYEAVMSGNA